MYRMKSQRPKLRDERKFECTLHSSTKHRSTFPFGCPFILVFSCGELRTVVSTITSQAIHAHAPLPHTYRCALRTDPVFIECNAFNMLYALHSSSTHRWQCGLWSSVYVRRRLWCVACTSSMLQQENPLSKSPHTLTQSYIHRNQTVPFFSGKSSPDVACRHAVNIFFLLFLPSSFYFYARFPFCLVRSSSARRIERHSQLRILATRNINDLFAR